MYEWKVLHLAILVLSNELVKRGSKANCRRSLGFFSLFVGNANNAGFLVKHV